MTVAATYALTITQNGVAITGDLSADGLTVHAKAKAARTCSYTYNIGGDGAVDLTALVGAPVVVTLNTGAGATTIFTGRVNRTPTYDTAKRTLSVTATDDWQAYCDGRTLAQLEVLIPNGLYSEDIDGERSSGLQQALALLATTPEDAFLNRLGTFETASWTPAASGSEDFTVSAAESRDVTPELVDADELINTMAVTYAQSFTRRVWNKVNFTWAGVANTWCSWYTEHRCDLPTQVEIQSVANGTGWEVIGPIRMSGHADNFGSTTGTYPCGPYIGFILTDYLRTEVTSAGWAGGQTYAVECRETLTLTVSAASSVAAYGARHGELSYSADSPYSADAVDADDTPTEPAGFTAYGTGDTQSYSDEIDTTQRTENIAIALAKARVEMLETHRRNGSTWTMLADPTIDLGQTATNSHPLAPCRGVVTELTHRVTSTSALTTVSTSAYIGGGGSDDSLTAPAVTVQAPTESAPASVSIFTKIGNQLDSENYDEDWELGSYWVCNAAPWICVQPNCPTDEQLYETTSMYIEEVEISETARDAVELTGSASYAIAIPATTISITGG